MNRLESELLDLEELLMRNDGMADDGTYLTIVGIANDVSELEAENDKLRELVREMYEDQVPDSDNWKYYDRMRELGIEVDDA